MMKLFIIKIGNKKDNIFENLEVLSVVDHARLHVKEDNIGQAWVKLKCPNCGVIFDRLKNKTHLTISKNTKFTACSKYCSGKFTPKLKTIEGNKILENNVIEEYRVYLND